MASSKANKIIAITGYVGLINGLRRYLLPVALIRYGWSLQDYGTIYVIQTFAMAIPLLLGGYSTDLKGRRSTIVFSFFMFSVGVSIFSFVISGTSLLYLIIAQVITTVSSGITRMALSIQMADETEEEERTSSLGWQAAVRNFASFVGPLIFGFLFQNYHLAIFSFTDFEVGFAILAAMGVVGLFASFFLPETDSLMIEENREIHLSDITDDERSMQYAFGIQEIIIGFTSGLIVPYINFYILTEFNPSDWQWGLLTALGSMSVATGTIIASQGADGFGKGRTVVVFNLAVPILAGGIAFAPTLGWVSVFYIARITTANLVHPIWQSWYYSHIMENLRGRTMSIQRMSRRLARGLGTAGGPLAYTLLGAFVFPLGALFYPVAMLIPYLNEKRLESGKKQVVSITQQIN